MGNSLSFILDENGKEQTRNSEKGKVASHYFENLFTSSYSSNSNAWLQGFPVKVYSSMNQDLTKEVTEEEIQNVVFAINPESAPGPDGFTAFFFQKYWSVVKSQILQEIFGFFRTGVLPQEWNHTLICLIPKISPPQRMTDLRPISLCSLLYKIISKILTSRLKKHLPDIISPSQSAFVPERLVSDNILIAHEIVHNLRTNDKISREFMAVKTDMSKAFDRVEWPFLKDIMKALGFNMQWISWIIACVSSVSYSVLINGQAFGYIKPARGIRQGDPLSSSLFVLCTEALIHILNTAERARKISGIKFQETGVSVNHLLFADDTLLMCKATRNECEELMSCLSTYDKVSGQMINVSKSAVTFGSKIDEETKDWIKNRSGIALEGGSGKYLDSLCWALTRNGVYTVKSGYDFISNQVHHDLFKKAEENPSLNPLFLKIWNLHTVPKIKNFLWRLLNGSIAVEDRLRTRGLKNADGCLLCGSESETINHVMFQCSLSRQVWAMSLVPSPLNGFGDSLFTNLAHLFDMSTNPSLSPLLREISPWILWALWKNRNKNLFEGIGLMTNLIIAKAFEDCQEWCLAQENLMNSSLTHKAAGAQNWNAPRSGDLKCNIGYAWSKHHQVSGASWVVRNSNGIVLLHSRRSYSQDLELGREDPPQLIPHAAYTTNESRNRLTLIARPLNPRSQNLNAVVAALPRVWGLTSQKWKWRSVNRHSLDEICECMIKSTFRLGNCPSTTTEHKTLSVSSRKKLCVRIFYSKASSQALLMWLLTDISSTSRTWEVNLAFEYLSTITLWVQMRGIPLVYVCEETVVEIAHGLGEIISLDFHDATTTQIAYIRVRIRFDLTDRIRFFQRIIFDSGESALIRFQYERLRRICSSCFRLTHHRNYCPFRQPEPLPLVRGPNNNPSRTRREGVRTRDEYHRSSLNSQSQMSENSFPAPIEPLPRVAAPVLNPNDLISRDSNIQPISGLAIAENVPRVFEIGESSSQGEIGNPGKKVDKGDSTKRKNMSNAKSDEEETSPREVEHKDGGILKPPKKR
ncbi:hypothetical protein AXX17_AT1G43730 [Arabidopsis thaliana]|uniref:Reverse transcriptase domain-containing protein n=1 Tax=Arabidopsis thaliana TaxID=3702 RepID=A0A178WQB8_ARATH|nr:hypothetical protein AXX17_AT1G43730 [Arabidopsis thaliana]